MRKLLFSALAIVAFGSVSFANNQAKLEKLDILEIKKNIILYNDCNERQRIAVGLCVEFDCDPYEAFFYGAAEWGRCMAGN